MEIFCVFLFIILNTSRHVYASWSHILKDLIQFIQIKESGIICFDGSIAFKQFDLPFLPAYCWQFWNCRLNCRKKVFRQKAHVYQHALIWVCMLIHFSGFFTHFWKIPSTYIHRHGLFAENFLPANQTAISKLPAICRQKRQIFSYVICIVPKC